MVWLHLEWERTRGGRFGEEHFLDLDMQSIHLICPFLKALHMSLELSSF